MSRTVDFTNSGVSSEDAASRTGVAGSHMAEGNPRYIPADNEHVITDASKGAYIILGKDRPGSRISGYGSEHNAARVEMVVGRVAAEDHRGFNKQGEEVYVDNSFKSDAARIYMSQKSDIDFYFGLAVGKVGKSVAKSSVGIKADAVRIIGREGIKLVTRTEPLNSQGPLGITEWAKGIDLIAGNDDSDLQPMVKGRSLIEALTTLTDWVGKLNGIIDLMLLNQENLTAALQFHTHISTLPALPTTPPDPGFQGVAAAVQTSSVMNGSISLKLHRTAAVFIKGQYLSSAGTNYILSRYNHTN